MSVNRFQFIGNLTRDAEVQSTTGNRTRGIIDIAVTEVAQFGEPVTAHVEAGSVARKLAH